MTTVDVRMYGIFTVEDTPGSEGETRPAPSAARWPEPFGLDDIETPVPWWAPAGKGAGYGLL